MTKHSNVGEQLTSQQLHQRQKELRSKSNVRLAPTIITPQLHTPENLGSIYRLADAAGCQRVIVLRDDDEKLVNANKTLPSARNTEKHLDIHYWTTQELIDKHNTLPPILALEITTRSKSLFNTPLPEHCSFLIGHERHGIDKRLLTVCHQAVHVPMYGINSSMNVSHALAIALYEWRRQHQA